MRRRKRFWGRMSLTAGFDRAMEIVVQRAANLVILDEINVALSFGLLQKEQMEKMLRNLSDQTELVCTGRNAPGWLMERADLITEMREIRHYYEQGIPARKGIEN